MRVFAILTFSLLVSPTSWAQQATFSGSQMHFNHYTIGQTVSDDSTVYVLHKRHDPVAEAILFELSMPSGALTSGSLDSLSSEIYTMNVVLSERLSSVALLQVGSAGPSYLSHLERGINGIFTKLDSTPIVLTAPFSPSYASWIGDSISVIQGFAFMPTYVSRAFLISDWNRDSSWFGLISGTGSTNFLGLSELDTMVELHFTTNIYMRFYPDLSVTYDTLSPLPTATRYHGKTIAINGQHITSGKEFPSPMIPDTTIVTMYLKDMNDSVIHTWYAPSSIPFAMTPADHVSMGGSSVLASNRWGFNLSNATPSQILLQQIQLPSQSNAFLVNWQTTLGSRTHYRNHSLHAFNDSLVVMLNSYKSLNGNYTYEFRAYDNAGNELGIKEPIIESKTKLFPIPANEILNMAFDPGVQSWELLNLQGQVLSQEKVNSLTHQLDTSSLPSGRYMIRCHYVKGAETLSFIVL